MSGIPCVILSGMNKSAAYEIGKKADRQAMGAQWNAVYVEGNWRFIDAFWACACVVGKKSGKQFFTAANMPSYVADYLLQIRPHLTNHW